MELNLSGLAFHSREAMVKFICTVCICDNHRLENTACHTAEVRESIERQRSGTRRSAHRSPDEYRVGVAANQIARTPLRGNSSRKIMRAKRKRRRTKQEHNEALTNRGGERAEGTASGNEQWERNETHRPLFEHCSDIAGCISMCCSVTLCNPIECSFKKRMSTNQSKQS
jgi:hypothetical protein